MPFGSKYINIFSRHLLVILAIGVGTPCTGQAETFWRETFDHLDNWNTTIDPQNYGIVDLGTVVDPALADESAVSIAKGGRIFNELHTNRTVSTGDIGYPGEGETRYLYYWGVYNHSNDSRIGGGFSRGDALFNELSDGFGFHHLQRPDERLLVRFNGNTAANPDLDHGDYDHRIRFIGGGGGSLLVTWQHKQVGVPAWTTSHIEIASRSDFPDRLVKLGVDNYAEGAYVNEIEFTDQDKLFRTASQGASVPVDRSPFVISSLVQSVSAIDMNLSRYIGANMNTLLAFKADGHLALKAANANVPWQMHVDTTASSTAWDSGELPARLRQIARDYPGNTAWYTKDEPQFLSMHDSAPISVWLKTVFPDSKVITNALPYGASARKMYGDDSRPGYNYEQYLDDIITIIQPDILMVDQYPFADDGDTSRNFMHSTMDKIRDAAQNHQIPYHIFVQGFDKDSLGRRLPSESDIRMQVFAAMAHGFTGISYFTYDPFGDYGGGDRTLVSPYGGPTPQIFEDVTKTNAEVAILGKALGRLDNTEVRWVDGGTGSGPPSHNDWSVGAGGDGHIKDIMVIDVEGGGIGSDEDGLIGFFEDDHGENYFLLANMYHKADTAAADTELEFHVLFDEDVNQLLRLNRQTGLIDVISFNNNLLNVTLPGGTGDLFKYVTGYADVFPIAGDANADGIVDISDLAILGANFNKVNQVLATGDFNGDGEVDVSDLAILGVNWTVSGNVSVSSGPIGISSSAIIPEPATVAIGFLGFAGMACRGRYAVR